MPASRECTLCGAHFKLPGSLTRHRRRYHSGPNNDQTPTIIRPGRYEPHAADNDNEENWNNLPAYSPPPLERTFPYSAGTPIAPIGYTPHKYEKPDWNPLEPFETIEQWKLCQIATEHNLTQSALKDMLRNNLFQDETRITSPKHLHALVQSMDDGLNAEWRKDTLDIEGIKCEFWCRDPLQCIRFIIGHAPFKDHLKYAPEKVYGDGGRLYNEMWTGDWWWREQVSVPFSTDMQGPLLITAEV